MARLGRVRTVLVLRDRLKQLLIEDQVQVRLVGPHVLITMLRGSPVDLLLLEAPVLDPATTEILQLWFACFRERSLTSVWLKIDVG